jgi:hypothetical protein
MKVPAAERKDFKNRMQLRVLRTWQFWVIFLSWFVGLYFFIFDLWGPFLANGRWWGNVLTIVFLAGYNFVFTKARPLAEVPAIRRELRASGFCPSCGCDLHNGADRCPDCSASAT